MRPLLAITPRSDAEWPDDHPLRGSVDLVLPEDLIPRDAAVLICSDVGHAAPCPPDDREVESTCGCHCGCRRAVVHRASAPKLRPVCHGCWVEIYRRSA